MDSLMGWEEAAATDDRLVSYQLHIFLEVAQHITIGRLGRFTFPAGQYLYTGSARRHLVPRVRRHLSKQKKLRWHIDYLLSVPQAQVTSVTLSAQPECLCNQQAGGAIIVPGFGASDCHDHCGSHLKYFADEELNVEDANSPATMKNNAPSSQRDTVEAYLTKDGSLIRELMHPSVQGNAKQSLAEATVPVGQRTHLHRHQQSEELYHITAGQGRMMLGDAVFNVSQGDTICIPPGTPHCIENTGEQALVVLCCCAPSYAHDDTELLE